MSKYDIDNIYNFKNTIRHFISIENIEVPFSIENIEIEELSYTEPINFRVRKNENQYRMLRIPNILNFICAYEKFENYKHFSNTSFMDEHKRLVPNLYTGDFATGVYDSQLEDDLYKLCIYDNLIKLDIKSYYGRIYAHHIEFENIGDEKYLTNLNQGNTNGLIMGNYLSLYFAEKYSKKISDKIKIALEERGIDCEFSYFSDDFYFFCNKLDNEKIICIFDMVLEEFLLERKRGDVEIYEYLDYSDINLIEKYWKKIISNSKYRFREDREENKLYFINQLIYRMRNLKDDKQRRTFLVNFFKSTYFQEFDIEKYILEEYNFHQLCYIFKFCPEILLYSIEKFAHFNYFREDKFKTFLKKAYCKSLLKSYNEEQLYYYYSIKILGFDDVLKQTENTVVECNNQILISYYLKDGIFNPDNIEKLKQNKSEAYWFQNYHLILFSNLEEDLESSIKEYLLPEGIRENPKNKKSIIKKQKNYVEFYKKNLLCQISIIKNIDYISKSIEDYIKLKISERLDIFSSEENL
ncbi:hypothetical protein P5F02_07525 [Clostridium perfringens]|nr:hypothetical protein [Clostridium perfringens]MDK0579816.1 hypothetical protein [Clostridium perfringens]